MRTGIATLYDPAGPPPDVLFIGRGATPVAWYRCYLPALFMGADWIGVIDEPPDLRLVTGMVRGRAMTMPQNFFDYKVIVVQQPAGEGWRRHIRRLQERGVKVLFEVDDYVHAIRKLPKHDYREHFNRDHLRELERTMRVCDGIICSTEYIARRYRAFNENVWVCENGLDVGRYELTRPERPTVNIGWAGGTGHEHAVHDWMVEAGRVMVRHDDTCIITIGQAFALGFREAFGERRTLYIPFTALEVYPAAMTMFDIALAPAGKGLFFKGKSDLRWLEAGALGIPIIADPDVYPKIEHGVTGFHARTPSEAGELLEELVSNRKLRLEVGANAKEYVSKHRDMRVAVRRWVEVLNAAAAL